MPEAEKEPKRIAPFNDEQIEEADRRIEEIAGILSEANEFAELGLLSREQIADLERNLAMAKKIRKIMDRRLPIKK